MNLNDHLDKTLFLFNEYLSDEYVSSSNDSPVCDDSVSVNCDIISDNNEILTFRTVLQTAEKPNRNGRIYIQDVFREGFKDPIFVERVTTRTFFGESQHPMLMSDKKLSVMRQARIELSRVSHLIPKIGFNSANNLITGTIETTRTPRGKDFREMILHNKISPAFSLRALGGNVENKGGYALIKPPIAIIAYDWVSIPSHHDAYSKSPNEVMSANSRNIVIENVQEIMKEYNDSIKVLSEEFSVKDCYLENDCLVSVIDSGDEKSSVKAVTKVDDKRILSELNEFFSL